MGWGDNWGFDWGVSGAQDVDAVVLDVGVGFGLATVTSTYAFTTVVLDGAPTLGLASTSTTLSVAAASLSFAEVLGVATVTTSLAFEAVTLDGAPTLGLASTSTTLSVTASTLTIGVTLPGSTFTTPYTIVAASLSFAEVLWPAEVNLESVSQSVTAASLTLFPSLRLASFTTNHILYNTAAGGTNEVQITSGNSGGASGSAFDVVSGGTGSTPDDRVVFSTARYRPETPGMSIFCDSGSTGGEYVAWTTSWPDTPSTCYIRAYFLMMALPGSSGNRLIRCFDSIGTEIAFFRVDASGNPGIGDSTGSSIEPSGPRVLNLDAFYRVELAVKAGTPGSITASIYFSQDALNIPDYTWTLSPAATNVGSANLAEVRFGNSVLATETYFDNIGIRDDHPWGLDGTGNSPQTVTATWLTTTPSLGLASVTNPALPTSFTANRLLVTASFPAAVVVLGGNIDAVLLDAAPSLPTAEVNVIGPQDVTALAIEEPWDLWEASFALAVATVAGSVDATVGREHSSRREGHMAKRFQVGEIAHLGATCKVLGVLTDPTTVTLQLINPSGENSSVTFADGQIDQDGTGLYSYDLPLTDEGTWLWRWVTSGACAGADEGEILVRSSAFV